MIDEADDLRREALETPVLERGDLLDLADEIDAEQPTAQAERASAKKEKTWQDSE